MAARTYSKPTIPVRARRRESMDLDARDFREWENEEPTQPRSKTRIKAGSRLAIAKEEVVLVSEYDPRRED